MHTHTHTTQQYSRVLTVTFSGTKDVGPMKGSSTCLAKIFKSQLDHFEDAKKSQLRHAMQKSVVLVSYSVTSPINWLQEIIEEGQAGGEFNSKTGKR